MEMPGADFMGAALAAAVANGTIAAAYVDDAVVRTLTPMFQVRPKCDNNEQAIMHDRSTKMRFHNNHKTSVSSV